MVGIIKAKDANDLAEKFPDLKNVQIGDILYYTDGNKLCVRTMFLVTKPPYKRFDKSWCFGGIRYKRYKRDKKKNLTKLACDVLFIDKCLTKL